MLMDAFIQSQFNHCPIVWMFHDRRANTKFIRFMKEHLRIACKDSGNNFGNSLNKSLKIHQRNLQFLVVEIFQTKNNQSNFYEG